MSSTFRPVFKIEQFKEKIIDLCEELAERIDKRKIAGLTITLGVKSTKFDILQKS